MKLTIKGKQIELRVMKKGKRMDGSNHATVEGCHFPHNRKQRHYIRVTSRGAIWRDMRCSSVVEKCSFVWFICYPFCGHPLDSPYYIPSQYKRTSLDVCYQIRPNYGRE